MFEDRVLFYLDSIRKGQGNNSYNSNNLILQDTVLNYTTFFAKAEVLQKKTCCPCYSRPYRSAYTSKGLVHYFCVKNISPPKNKREYKIKMLLHFCFKCYGPSAGSIGLEMCNQDSGRSFFTLQWIPMNCMCQLIHPSLNNFSFCLALCTSIYQQVL
jgi:hypothetical protein